MNAEKERQGFENMPGREESELELIASNQEGVYQTQERAFNREQALYILDQSELLKELDSKKTALLRMSSLDTTIPEEDNLSLSTLYRVAESARIPREYVDKIVAMRYPSPQQQLEDVEKFNIKPSPRGLLMTYCTNFGNALKSHFPMDEFIHSHLYGSYGYVIERIKKIIKKGFFGKKKIEREVSPFATIEYDESSRGMALLHRTLNITLLDPCFIRACGKTLAELNKRFSGAVNKIEITHDYKLDCLK